MNIPFSIRRCSPLALPALLLGLVACHEHHDDEWYFTYGYQTKAVAIADVQGDGKAAVVSANTLYGEGTPNPGFVTVRLQDPVNAGHFLDPIESDTGHDPIALALADLSGGTGRLDLVVAHRQVYADPGATNAISVQLHDPAQAGRFLAPTSLSLGTRNPSDVAVGDLNHDGRPDIAVAADGANSVMVFQQNADGTFTSSLLDIGAVPTALALGDLNGDGYLDLAVATTGGTVLALLQDAAHPGQFLAGGSYAVGSNPVSVKLASLSDPSRLDILTANYGTNSAPTTKGLSVLLHDPAHTGAFLAATTYDTGDYLSSSLAVGDPAAVGSTTIAPYIVVANQGAPGWPGTLSVFLTDTTTPGTFLTPLLYDGTYGPRSVAIGEFWTTAVIAADGGTFMRFETTPGSFGSLVRLRQ